MIQFIQKLFLFVTCIFLSACSNSHHMERADDEAGEFHKLFNAGKFGQIYDNTTPEFKNFASEFRFTKVLNRLTQRLGSHQKSTLSDWSSSSAPRGGTQITLHYHAVYEKDANVQEIFTFIIRHNNTQLANFNVASEKLKETDD